MKKTLIALAAMSAFAAAGTAAAADVTLYGKADLGLHYTYNKVDGQDAVNSFDMKSGQNAGSRFGLKGTEDLGNGTKVGFILENGFNADDGTMGQDSRLFGREANLFVTGDFGTLSMGRVGALSSGMGSYNVVYGYAAFGTGWGDYAGAKSQFNLADRDRMDNTVTYVTPNFAGVKVYAQYSFSTKGQETAGNERQNQRYAGLGVKYDLGSFSTGLVVDTVLNNYANTNSEDSLGVTWGASYDFGVAKVYGMAQYGKNENKLGGYSTSLLNDDGAGNTTKVLSDEGLEGYALTLGVTAPVAGGTVFAQANYTDGQTSSDVVVKLTSGSSTSSVNVDADITRWGVAAGYSYPFSKRTYVYTYAAYNEGKADLTAKLAEKPDTSGSLKVKDKVGEFGLGLVHSF